MSLSPIIWKSWELIDPGTNISSGPTDSLVIMPTWYSKQQLSHGKKPLTFHYTGCLIGILDPYYGLFPLLQSLYNWVV